MLNELFMLTKIRVLEGPGTFTDIPVRKKLFI